MTKTAAAQTVSALDRAISANWYVVPAPTLEQRRADAIAAILRGERI